MKWRLESSRRGPHNIAMNVRASSVTARKIRAVAVILAGMIGCGIARSQTAGSIDIEAEYRAACEKVLKKDFAGALTHYERIEEKITSARIHFDIAQCRFELGQYRSVIKKLEAQLAMDPTHRTDFDPGPSSGDIQASLFLIAMSYDRLKMPMDMMATLDRLERALAEDGESEATEYGRATRAAMSRLRARQTK